MCLLYFVKQITDKQTYILFVIITNKTICEEGCHVDDEKIETNKHDGHMIHQR